MNQVRSLRFWIRCAILLLLLLSFFCFAFVKRSVLPGEDVVMPEHEAVQGEDPAGAAARNEDYAVSRRPVTGTFLAGAQTRGLSVRYERAEGTISSSLCESAVQSGLPREIVMGLTDIYAWDINFFTDIREGDSFQVLYERYYEKNAFKGFGRIVAARFLNRGREHVALYYTDKRSISGYFDEEGKPVRSFFLKAPLDYRSVASGYSTAMMRPVLHKKMPHLGVDYPAPSGTPVITLGAGRVIYKGSAKGLGKCIMIAHPSGHVTYYGHLSAFPRGISLGETVGQGQVIGYVGMTGYATSPHLDFRVLRAGRFINPFTLASGEWPGLKGRELARFREIKARRLAMLDDFSLNYTMKLSTRY
jgi:murein DD-endopeptidase MepM/ murein hydrolase activator NlpD